MGSRSGMTFGCRRPEGCTASGVGDQVSIPLHDDIAHSIALGVGSPQRMPHLCTVKDEIAICLQNEIQITVVGEQLLVNIQLLIGL